MLNILPSLYKSNVDQKDQPLFAVTILWDETQTCSKAKSMQRMSWINNKRTFTLNIPTENWCM